MTGRNGLRSLDLIVALLAVASCTDRATAPSMVSASIATVSIVGLPAAFTVGDTAQLRATAMWSDGRSEDVTGRVRWTSRTLVCVVTPGGQLTALELGDCAVSASLEGATTVATVTVGASSLITFSGVVRERFESGEPPIPGAVVTVKTGSDANRRVIADDRGRYTLERMPKMPVTVEFAATGFEAEPLTLTADNPTRDVMLSPADVLIEWNDRPGLPGDRATFPFEVRHRGPFVLSARSLRYECGTYEKFGAYLRNVDRNDAFTGLSPCVPGVVSSVSGYLDRGRYELVVWAQFGFGEKIRWATLTHPW